jgi:hypothetical protein
MLKAMSNGICLWCLVVFGLSSDPASATQKGKSAGVTGTVTLSNDCKAGRIEVWLSSGRTLIYQAEVPSKGSFEFYTVPGKYNLVATSSSGCFAETAYEAKEGRIEKITLTLDPAKPSPKKEKT